MMKCDIKTALLFMSALPLFLATGCIKDELPNIGVDIKNVTSENGNILTVVYHNDAVDVYVEPNTDPSAISLNIEVSEGASILPDPGEVKGYEVPRVFSVTSEDRNWTKKYTVAVRYAGLPLKFDFENWKQPERMRYMIPVELCLVDGKESELGIWASGNEAFNFLTNKDDDYTVFPTQPTDDAASGDKALKLVTCLTGQFDKPVAAGNLFLGQFDASLREPRESTMFGLPFSHKPLRVTGKYKYKSGGRTYFSATEDKCRILAVMYLTDENVTHLNGFNIRTSPNIVGMAELEDGSSTPGDGYHNFDIHFRYDSNKEINPELLANGRYNLALVFSSSIKGDVYDGAPGSTLFIDDVEIICE